MSMQGKVAIVTGASGGTGRAYVLALAAEGATVVATARTLGRPEDALPQPDTLAEVVAASRSLPGRVLALRCDMESDEDVARMVGTVVANHGRIDILVNNAGIYPLLDTYTMTMEEWDRTLNVNVRGVYCAIRAVAPVMIRQRSGNIINMTSGAAGFTPVGKVGHDGLVAYAVSKAALNRLTTFMAEELRQHDIAVNAMSPGAVISGGWKASYPEAMDFPGGKPPTPEIMGPALLYLASRTARELTGQILHNDEFGKSWPATPLTA